MGYQALLVLSLAISATFMWKWSAGKCTCANKSCDWLSQAVLPRRIRLLALRLLSQHMCQHVCEIVRLGCMTLGPGKVANFISVPGS